MTKIGAITSQERAFRTIAAVYPFTFVTIPVIIIIRTFGFFVSEMAAHFCFHHFFDCSANQISGCILEVFSRLGFFCFAIIKGPYELDFIIEGPFRYIFTKNFHTAYTFVLQMTRQAVHTRTVCQLFSIAYTAPQRCNTLDFPTENRVPTGMMPAPLGNPESKELRPLDTPLCSCRGYLPHLGLSDFSCPNMTVIQI